MHYRRLGRTGLAVSPICLGTMGFGPPTHQDQVDQLVRTALDLGVNFLDTANCYDGPHRNDLVEGHSEKMLGMALRDGLRDEFVLLSKAGVPLKPGPQHRGLSSTHLLRELDHSLRRLQTDYLDVYMIHWPDPYSESEEVLRAMETALRAGKIRYFGVSNHQGWQVCEYLWKADRRGWPVVGVSEIPLSILNRSYENDLPFYVRHQIGILAYQPLMGGALTDRWRSVTASSPDEGNADKVAGWNITLDAQQRDVIDRLGTVADRWGHTLAELALAWTMAQDAVASVVLGSRSPKQLQSAAESAELSLTDDIRNAIDEICPGPEKPTPRFER